MNGGKFIICMVFVFSLVIGGDRTVEAQNSQKNNECFTPNDLYGKCINIKRCPTLLYLLEYQRHNSSIVTFLRNSECGNEDNFPYYPKVCCPLKHQPTSPAYDTETSQRITTPKPGSSKKLPLQETCGRTNVTDTRIFGGSYSELGAWPWMAALGYINLHMPNHGYEWMCGGALISDRYVLTAAHCFVNTGKYILSVVRLGDLNLNPEVVDGAKPIDVEIKRVITHEQYNRPVFTNDIALLKLKNIVEFNELIQPICLPISSHHRTNTFVDTELSFAGWGSTMRNTQSDAQMYVQLPVVDNLKCKEKYSELNVDIDDTHLCAGSTEGDSCTGDSGGPLMWPNGKQFYLVGVLNFGPKLCGAAPGVYARVTSFVEWIKENMNYCS